MDGVSVVGYTIILRFTEALFRVLGKSMVRRRLIFDLSTTFPPYSIMGPSFRGEKNVPSEDRTHDFQISQLFCQLIICVI